MLTVKQFQFNPIAENTYIVYNSINECIIIDPGCYGNEEEDTLAAFIEKGDLRPVLLLNTHCHLDHVFGNKFVAEKYGLVLHIHEKEKAVLDFGPTSGLMYNLPFDNYTGDISFLPSKGNLRAGNIDLEILFTPGHSPGSLSFYSAASKFVISGDTLFAGSVGRSDLPGGDHAVLINSIKQKLMTLPDDTVVYSGHGESTTIGEEKVSNPFLN